MPKSGHSFRSREIQLLVGTRKGAFVFRSDLRRRSWKADSPSFAGTEVNHMLYDPRSGRHWVAINSWFFGSQVQWSSNCGRMWHKVAGNPKCSTKATALTRLWTLAIDRDSRPDTLWCGGDPGVLFRSDDGGKHWHEIASLTKHSTRRQWMPGAGGMCTHTIIPDPKRSCRLFIAISAAGCFRSDDDGATWQPMNKNVRADFAPNRFPAVGQCVHHMVMSPVNSDWLFQQNHCGVYRTRNAAVQWDDISKGLPSRFGFPMVMHPHEAETIYVVPEYGAERRYVCGQALTVYRSRNGGRTWRKLTRGLPQKNCFVQVLRQAAAADTCDETGIYIGTNAGEIFYSRNSGDAWELLAEHLPPVLSLETAVV